MALVEFIVNPASGANVSTAFNTALSNVSDGGVIFAYGGDFTFSGQTTTSKKNFKLVAWTPAQGTWNSVTRVFSWVTEPSVIWRRSESTSDASLEAQSFIRFNQSTQADCGIEIRGIHFASKEPSYVGALTSTPPQAASDGKSLALDFGLYFYKCVNFKVTQCKFSYFGDGAIRVEHWDDNPKGLISLNEFKQCAKGWEGGGEGYGVAVYGISLQWQSDLVGVDEQYGSGNFLCVENNGFNYCRHDLATSSCAKVLFRYNYILDTKISIDSVCHSVDSHSPRGGSFPNANYYGTYAIEAYGNNIVHTKFWSDTGITGDPIIPGESVGRLMQYGLICRAGGALYYDNWIAGTRFGVGIYVDSTPFGTTYPLPYCLGYKTSRLYVWGNSFTPYVSGNDWAGLPLSTGIINVNNGVYQTEYFQLNRDYFYSTDNSAKPSWYTSAYTYPHPNSDLATTIVGTPRITFTPRTYRPRL